MHLITRAYCKSPNGYIQKHLKNGCDLEAIMVAVCSTDEDLLKFSIKRRADDGKLSYEKVGWIYLVYGNDGTNVISDYSANERMEEVLKPVFEWIERLENGNMIFDEV